MSSGPPKQSELPALFEKTPVPKHGPGAHMVRTAACLIIGDEVLNGKTHDSNSNTMAKLCFELGIEMKRVEVIPDDEEIIVEAARRLSHTYDWVVTSGGIGPTPDDITYASLARAFGAEPLEYNQETIRRMDIGNKRRFGDVQVPEDVVTARRRMALFPSKAEVIFPTQEYWVPVVRMNGNVCVLPGVPRIFTALLHALPQYLALDPNMPRPIRKLIHTDLPESALAPLLIRLTNEGKKENVRVGSYPKWNDGVHVSLIGYEADVVEKYVSQVVNETHGNLIDNP